MSEQSLRRNRFASTVSQELLVAASGLILVFFIVGHLAGNFLLFRGPEAFNGYAEKLQSMGPLLWLVRFGLLTSLITHVGLTIRLRWLGYCARDRRYAVRATMGGTTFAKQTMIYTGLLVFLFLFLHLYDFTFGDKTGALTIVSGRAGGEELGLYGLVWNSFLNPVRVGVYVAAVWAVGLHFSNAVSTIWVTLGVLSDAGTLRANRAARVLGAFIALGFCAIPLYVLATTYWLGV